MLDDPGALPAPFARLILPPGDYAQCRHDGSYDGLEASNDRLIDAVLASGREPADFPLFHHFLDDPEEVAPEALRTDVLLRLLPRATDDAAAVDARGIDAGSGLTAGGGDGRVRRLQPA
jgi:DNA gyrase inhibitor GyrI